MKGEKGVQGEESEECPFASVLYAWRRKLRAGVIVQLEMANGCKFYV
jgi:hypothetical protein